MNYNDIKLPPLPAPISREIERQYSVQQLEAYAREAVRLNSCRAALTQQREAEPAVYQSRMRPEFDRYHAWTPWENCSKGKYEDIKRVPVNAGWIFEARALYLHPPKPTAQPQVAEGMLRVELAMSDRSISRLIHVAQIETSNTNEVERYANQCWRELSAAKEEGE